MPITNNVLQRTFRLKCDAQVGTCFTLDIDERQYLITAQHVASSIAGSSAVEIFHEGTWKNLQVDLVGHGEHGIDITVLAPKQLLSPRYLLSTGGFSLGQDVWFLGFPYGLMTEAGDLNANFPLPFVKKGIVSSFSGGDVPKVFLDGHNNPGFSGGPVVGYDDAKELVVIGIVSGYLHTWEPIYNTSNQVPLNYKDNTGIVEVYGIKQAVNLIHANPVGFLA